ncbi:S8 family serine peptidase [Gilvimarinus sp. 1_MG-2023]|uniref:S8 family serine peptidase n=1 Tax=Gilvimarinus sp. 1_MG-2023 TaxID=3062638 RepID=UPI0026E43DB5|nr:S8 family serine peptidase [Gilvimarinus sp. 1_MG-2023]MDO6745618.1 S8 family serine peptidase [Gilvimarinus sp. 1_MG-2023]
MNKMKVISSIILLASPLAWSQNYLDIPSGKDPKKYQWGLHAMEFPDAWEITTGNAYVGVVDGVNYQEVQSIEGLKSNLKPHMSNKLNNYVDPGKVIHSLHVAGIVAADGKDGIYGGCPTCNLMVWSRLDEHEELTGIRSGTAEGEAIEAAIESGVQVINLSWGGSTEYKTTIGSAITNAKNRDVLIVAASGNRGNKFNGPDFPAKNTGVLAVGAMSHYDFDGWILMNYACNNDSGDIYVSQPFDEDNGGVVAPGLDILSYYVKGDNYLGLESLNENDPDYPVYPELCLWTDSDNHRTVVDPNIANDGIGLLSGTSMAAPHVSALAGIIRSINPLMSASTAIEKIKKASDRYGASYEALTELIEMQESNFEDEIQDTFGTSDGSVAYYEPINPSSPSDPSNLPDPLGSGLPSASRASHLALATLPSRLTPLFSLYSNDRKDHFYTTIPQMAVGALNGLLLPTSSENSASNIYTTFGEDIRTRNFKYGYNKFPSLSDTIIPKAEIFVFTTPQNPSTGDDLSPLYRVSKSCESEMDYFCINNPNNVDIGYAIDMDELQIYKNSGYSIDGIEGYVYPYDEPQPPGTVKLFKGYSLSVKDIAIFPETKLQEMEDKGYTGSIGKRHIGYVYENLGAYEPLLDQHKSIQPHAVPLKPTSAIIVEHSESRVLRFTWSKVPGADKYKLHFYARTNPQGGFTKVELGASSSICRSTGSTCSSAVQLTTALKYSEFGEVRPFHWEVRARVNGTWQSRKFVNSLSVKMVE